MKVFCFLLLALLAIVTSSACGLGEPDSIQAADDEQSKDGQEGDIDRLGVQEPAGDKGTRACKVIPAVLQELPVYKGGDWVAGCEG